MSINDNLQLLIKLYINQFFGLQLIIESFITKITIIFKDFSSYVEKY